MKICHVDLVSSLAYVRPNILYTWFIKRNVEHTLLVSILADSLLSSKNNKITIAQLHGTIEYTDCISAEGKTAPTRILDITLNNLMSKFQIL